MRSASVERRLQRAGNVAKTWRMRGEDHANDVGRGFLRRDRRYNGLAWVVLRSAYRGLARMSEVAQREWCAWCHFKGRLWEGEASRYSFRDQQEASCPGPAARARHANATIPQPEGSAGAAELESRCQLCGGTGGWSARAAPGLTGTVPLSGCPRSGSPTAAVYGSYRAMAVAPQSARMAGPELRRPPIPPRIRGLIV